MKKRILTFLLAASMILLTGCHSSNNSTPTGGNPDSSKEELTKLTLNEVAHSIFYAPMYVAIEKDYFRQEGIELELVTGFWGCILSTRQMIQYSQDGNSIRPTLIYAARKKACIISVVRIIPTGSRNLKVFPGISINSWYSKNVS